MVNSTPFDIDITPYVKYGKENEIAFRITDPNGNFNWKDSQLYTWGNYFTNPSHGFGGITGKVTLIATDPLYISDVFIKNKPQPHEIEVEISLDNGYADVQKGKEIQLEIMEHVSGKSIYKSILSRLYKPGATPKLTTSLCPKPNCGA